MPIYEYNCKSCDAKFEQLVKSMNGPAQIACPECSSTKTARLLSMFAVNKESSKAASSPAGICGRCGGPGPCATDFS